jgi:predicted O-linked N-acetylglucosamine transferase (SPINDLY family)
MSNPIINTVGTRINKVLSKLNLKVIRYSSFDFLENEIKNLKGQLFVSQKSLESSQWLDTKECFGYTQKHLESCTIDGSLSSRALRVLYNTTLRAAFLILSNRHLLEIELSAQVEIIQKIFITLITLQHRQAELIASLLAKHFYRILNHPDLQPEMAFKIYESLYGLYWCGATCLEDMSPFDKVGVRPFAQYIRKHFVSPFPQSDCRKLQIGAPLNIAYICHYAHFDRGNAIAPIIMSLAKGHAHMSDRKIFIYCVQWVSDEFIQSFDGTEITVRSLPQQANYQSLNQIIDQIKVDQIDVLITDVSSSIATYLFLHRVAPLQLWLELGYPYWTIPELDWVFLCAKEYQHGLGVPIDKCSYLMPMQEETTLTKECSQEALEQARSQFPTDCFLFGVFTRLIKITPIYLDIVRNLLEALSKAHLLIVGTGDPTLIYEFLDNQNLKDRVTFFHYNVDLNVYGRIIDVFLDTFPFIGGNACREVAIHGKPIVALYASDFGRLLIDERDSDLLTKNPDEYLAAAIKLTNDSDFYQTKSRQAIELVRQSTDVMQCVTQIDEVIQKLSS